ncbi:leucyl aminopeptidase [Moraxella nasovis]|uniref:leucyl aminopeptidase n=1 Tax=Moraxella nasovis TaxID=2904121 RepID=UPI001F60B1D2|nr:leucyl aminopeptidase [Moraxella nasovis]UNU74173.1 leucyl aminopeptidase [Moraxella nasovis]
MSKFNLSVLPKLSESSTASHLVFFADKQGNILGNAADALANTAHLERAQSLIKAANFKGDTNEVISDYALNSDNPAISVIGVGDTKNLVNNIKKLATTAYKTIKNSESAAIIWGDVICHKHFTWFSLALLNASYRFENHKSKKSDADTISTIAFINNKESENDYQDALTQVQATFVGQSLARDVANEAPNVLSPSALANEAQKLAQDYSDKVRVTVLGEEQMKELGMGCFLAVSQGSDEEGKLVVIEYFGKTAKSDSATLDNPIALVGKGITFDTGGISLKPAAGMEDMKYDMGGAAAMLGTTKAACEANLPLDMVTVLACAENMPSGHASRPGDIVTAMNGTTVEILNTDAEGRLVLCDALCYTQENYKPQVIIDSATLTGACVIALGSIRSAVYTNDEDTLFALESASDFTDDLVWQMPLDSAYDDQLKSTFADVQNIGGREAGSVTAACFLQRFIKDGQAWAHLDIAGTAWQSDIKGASGRPVPLLMQYLKAQSGK